MHDPMTVAFDIRRPWPVKRQMLGGGKYYPSIVTIWHVDPETDGTDRSCGYLSYVEGRAWYKHPRWHIWHWRIQVHFLQALKRRLFSRCSRCGKSFAWGYAPMSDSWNSSGPRWFRGESGVYHHECSRPTSQGQSIACD